MDSFINGLLSGLDEILSFIGVAFGKMCEHQDYYEEIIEYLSLYGTKADLFMTNKIDLMGKGIAGLPEIADIDFRSKEASPIFSSIYGARNSEPLQKTGKVNEEGILFAAQRASYQASSKTINKISLKKTFTDNITSEIIDKLRSELADAGRKLMSDSYIGEAANRYNNRLLSKNGRREFSDDL